jgi:hypothetical protein
MGGADDPREIIALLPGEDDKATRKMEAGEFRKLLDLDKRAVPLKPLADPDDDLAIPVEAPRPKQSPPTARIAIGSESRFEARRVMAFTPIAKPPETRTAPRLPPGPGMRDDAGPNMFVIVGGIALAIAIAVALLLL